MQRRKKFFPDFFLHLFTLFERLFAPLPEVPEPEKHEICKYMYLCVFWFGHFLRSGIKSESSFLIKCYNNYCSIFFCVQRLVPKYSVPKNGFPIVFSKNNLGGWKPFFWRIFFYEKAKHPRICPSFSGNVGET